MALAEFYFTLPVCGGLGGLLLLLRARAVFRKRAKEGPLRHGLPQAPPDTTPRVGCNCERAYRANLQPGHHGATRFRSPRSGDLFSSTPDVQRVMLPVRALFDEVVGDSSRSLASMASTFNIFV